MIKLPKPATVKSTHGCNAKGPYQHHTFYYTAYQLKQAIRDALEEAAKVCDQMHEEDRPGDYAAAIRKLKEDMQ